MEQVHKYYEALHQIPETSFQERQTAQYISAQLKSMGYQPVQVGQTGLYADLYIDPALPWLVLRADMDALPVAEETGVAYASQNPGVMHACGHDAHMAMLLSAAQQLQGMSLSQNVRFLFQPAEEIISGASQMIEAGALPHNTVAVFGMHVWPAVPKGKVLAKAGALMASSTTLRIRCTGRGAHCGKRQDGADALMTAAQIVTRFPEAEAAAGGDGTVLFCGCLHSGTAHNVVASHAELKGTLRSFSEDSRQKVLTKLQEIAAASAALNGTQIEVEQLTYNPAVINPETLIQKAQAVLPDALRQWPPALAAEDFARYQEQCPGVLLWLGVGDTAPLHNGRFLVPQEVLPVGVDTWLKVANHSW